MLKPYFITKKMNMKEKNSAQATIAEPIPKGFHTITPFLIVKDTVKLLEFIEKAFGGKTDYLLKHKNGKVMHASARIGDSCIMFADSGDKFPEMPAMLYIYVEDVDAVYKKALKAGGQSLREPVNEFYGDRSAGVKDNWGNQWWIATHVEEVDPDEIERRAAEYEKELAM
jgi:PhnB protein